MQSRKDFLIKIITEVCLSSAIYYNYHGALRPAVKLLASSGRLLYVLSDRKLDYVEYHIPAWDSYCDMQIVLNKLADKSNFAICESHNVDGEYCYTIILLRNP